MLAVRVITSHNNTGQDASSCKRYHELGPTCIVFSVVSTTCLGMPDAVEVLVDTAGALLLLLLLLFPLVLLLPSSLPPLESITREKSDTIKMSKMVFVLEKQKQKQQKQQKHTQIRISEKNRQARKQNFNMNE